MSKNKELIQAFGNILKGLSAKKKETLSEDIVLLIDHLSNLPGSFWADPEKKEATRAKMRQAHADRPTQMYEVTIEPSGRILEVNLDAVAKITGYTAHSVRCFISRGKGIAGFTVDEDTLKVRKILK